MKLNSLKDLEHLLPASERGRMNDAPRSFADSHDGKGKVVSIRLDAKGRNGKSVTLIQGLSHNPNTMQDFAKFLKQQCGAGGTVKEGVIEIQGDQRSRLAEILKELNYRIQ